MSSKGLFSFANKKAKTEVSEEPEPKKAKTEDQPAILENSWPLFLNKYVKTFSFCKFCNDRLYNFKEKMFYNKEMKCYIIQMPCCKKCAIANIEINHLHHEHFGNKKKSEE